MDISRVGEQYVVGQTAWPERAGYSYAADGHVLTVLMRSPDRRKVNAIRSGKSQFALVPAPGILFIMYRFGKAIGWSAAPYWGSIVPNAERSLPPEGSPGLGVVLHVVLVDAGTGIVRAERPVKLPPGFTCALHEAVSEYAILPPMSRAVYEAALASARQACPTSRRLLQRAVACTGPVPAEKRAHRVCLRECQLNELLDLVDWFTTHSYDDSATLHAESMAETLGTALRQQGFMRVH